MLIAVLWSTISVLEGHLVSNALDIYTVERYIYILGLGVINLALYELYKDIRETSQQYSAWRKKIK